MISPSVKRLRVFAGPNGSGKSTITRVVLDHVHLGVYVNADDLKVLLEKQRFLDFAKYGIRLNADNFVSSFKKSTLAGRIDNVKLTLTKLSFESNRILLADDYEIEDYFVSFITSFIWNELLECSKRFTVETVMSHLSKLDFMKKAQTKGFKVYLYFVTLADPELNKHRVQARVTLGGHPVDEQKIKERYYRTMNHLYEALKIADSAYLFDNSAGKPNLFAVKEHGMMNVISDSVPKWFETYVINAIERKQG